MAHYVGLGPVHTWYDRVGDGPPLVLLHPGGAGVDSRAFAPNVPDFARRFTVYLPERRGHGRTADVAGPYAFDLVAQDTVRFIEEVVGGPAHLAGMSDGAIVALHVALSRPDLVERLVVVAGVFHYAGWADGVVEAGAEPPAFLADSYAEIAPDGPGHYPVVVGKLLDMHRTGPALTAGHLARIGCRTLVMVGDDDEVRLEHALSMYRAIPRCELAIVPGTSHGLLVEKPLLCDSMIIDFLAAEAVVTLAPRRRAET
ncbi:MAG: alpha/beta hydrolase [Mycobacteriaceae bacterium]|nr:alpha/beta hydrolase [Mycobacteriaceae bacterium]